MIPAQAVEAATDALIASKLGDHPGINGEEFVEAAIAALEAAAPHMQRAVTSRKELDSLQVGSVVLSQGVAYQRYPDDDWAAEGRWYHGSQIELPATVLHDPSDGVSA